LEERAVAGSLAEPVPESCVDAVHPVGVLNVARTREGEVGELHTARAWPLAFSASTGRVLSPTCDGLLQPRPEVRATVTDVCEQAEVLPAASVAVAWNVTEASGWRRSVHHEKSPHGRFFGVLVH
jgi:hypothetical protein